MWTNPLDFTKATEMWKRSSLTIQFKGLRTHQPQNIRCHLIYIWTLFTSPWNNQHVQLWSGRLKQTLPPEQPHSLWDILHAQPALSYWVLHKCPLGASWTHSSPELFVWPRGPALLNWVPSLHFFPFLQPHFHFSGLLFYTKHWARLCAEWRKEVD